MSALRKTTCLALCAMAIFSIGTNNISASMTPPPPTIEQYLYMGTVDGPARRPGTSGTITPAGIASPLELPAWSRLVWSSYRDATQTTQSNYEIYRAIGNGNDQTRVTNNTSEDTQPDYNRGATRVAFVTKRTGNYEIYVMNANGSGQTRLTNNSSEDFYPRWSPDGSKIAFYSKRNGNWEIYVMNANGTNQVRLTNNSANDITPAWSPDGTKILFGSNRRSDGKWAIWVMNANGTSQTQFTPPSYFAGYPAWSPDGSKIAYNDDDNNDGWIDLALINVDGSGKIYPRDTSSSWREFFGPYFDPSGQYYAHTAVEWTYYGNQWYWVYAWIDRIDTTNNEHGNIIINGVDWWVSWATPDITAPDVRVGALPRYTASTPFAVTWTGADHGEAGLRKVDIQVRDGVSGTWILANSINPTTPSITYNGMDGHTYYFRARGIDNAWNTQPYTSNINGDAVITVDTSGPISLYLSAPALINTRQVSVTWGAQDAQSNIASYSITVTLDAGAPVSWLLNTTSTSGVYTIPSDKSLACFELSARNGAGTIATLSPVCTQVDDVSPTTMVTITQPISVPWFVVQWQGTDALSGIASYDAQMRTGAGAWTPWLTKTETTSEGFRGDLDTTYFFRVRATDQMGNIEPFSDDGVSVTTPLLAVAGTVVDNRGQPVALAHVDTLPTTLSGAMTGASGNYEFYLNATGTYTIAVTHDHYNILPPLKNVVIENSITLPELVLPPANDVITNGHFEAGGLANWLTGGDTSPIITTTAHTGDHAALLSATVSPVTLRDATPGESWIEQHIDLTGSSPVSPTLSVQYKTLSIQPDNSLSAIIVTASDILTYPLPVETTGWQHAWIALPDLTSPTMTVRLQWEQGDQQFVTGVLVDEVTLGSAIPPAHSVFLPIVRR